MNRSEMLFSDNKLRISYEDSLVDYIKELAPKTQVDTNSTQPLP